MTSILLVSINAKYIHSGLGARALQANLGDLFSESLLAEFDIRKRPSEIVEQILAYSPKILALGVYIWNVEIVTEVVQLVKTLAPEVYILLGGPEVSFPTDLPSVAEYAHYILCGEGEVTFPRLCRQLLSGTPPASRFIPPQLPQLDSLQLPYSLYHQEDIRNRILYIESSRGCPFGCRFCLSSLDKEVRYFNRAKLFEALDELLERGATQFKFTDRTFNCNIPYAVQILQFFLDRLRPGLFLHFEMVPHLLADELKNLLPLFPEASLQLEIGLQTFNPVAAKAISRTLHISKSQENIRWLRENTKAHLHTDLIGGLPGEDLQSFGHGFDTLLSWEPQEIQVGILKRLRGLSLPDSPSEEVPLRNVEGTPTRNGLLFSPLPPYEVLQTRDISYTQMCDLKRFARFWDLLHNSGRFEHSARLIWKGTPSAFESFWECTQWLFGQLHQQSQIALPRLARLLETFLVQVRHLDPSTVHQLIEDDLTHSHRSTQGSHSTRQERRETLSLQESSSQN